MNTSLSRVMCVILDCLYPRLEPLSKEASDREAALAKEERERYVERIAALPDNYEMLVQCLDACAKLLDEAEETRRSVEARLTSTLGLASVAGTIVFGGILALAIGTVRVDLLALRLLLVVGALYLVVQVCWAVLASIRGLTRRSYISMTASDALPLPGEDHPNYFRRRITLCARRIEDYRSNSRSKVNQMALAHRAMVNFVGGLIILAVVGTCSAFTSRNAGDQVIQTLKKNHELNEMLRGPQGPVGPKGDPGPPGPVSAPNKQQRDSLEKP